MNQYSPYKPMSDYGYEQLQSERRHVYEPDSARGIVMSQDQLKDLRRIIWNYLKLNLVVTNLMKLRA